MRMQSNTSLDSMLVSSSLQAKSLFGLKFTRSVQGVVIKPWDSFLQICLRAVDKRNRKQNLAVNEECIESNDTFTKKLV